MSCEKKSQGLRFEGVNHWRLETRMPFFWMREEISREHEEKQCEVWTKPPFSVRGLEYQSDCPLAEGDILEIF